MQNNPYLIDYIKPAPKNKAYKWGDLARHISVIGAALLIMSAPKQKEREDEEDEGRKSN